ncbi:hypothetical protein [Sulfitobacter aestuariivivens]|uniref:Uncharacterized protein n=1 Tax=Sulfitobacter aestuariivivens TaxID=2766981 RepID=A0A927D4X8_9RHOB|nr:hypothetical protein [Sulfitobacter aestuariivivens]
MTEGLSWAPKRAEFLRREVWVVGITFGALVVVGLGLSYVLTWPVFWVLPTALMLSIGFLLDDIMRWRVVRQDRWEISDGQLRHDGPDGTFTVPLSEIVEVRAGVGSRIIVQLRSGRRVVLRYLPDPAQTAAQINAACPK